MARAITGIRLENIGRFETFSLELRDGEIVEIQGDNDEGKSTIPKCVEAAIFGDLEEKTGPNHNAPNKEGRITVDIAGYTITRIPFIAPDGKVKTKSCEVVDRLGNRPYEGDAVQTFLNTLVPKGTFINPFALMGLKPKEQIAHIVKALPIDMVYAKDRLRGITQGVYDIEDIADAEMLFQAITRIDNDLRKERLALNREKETSEAAYRAAFAALPEDYTPDAPAPFAPPPMQELYQQKERITNANLQREDLTRRSAANEREIQQLQERIATLTNANRAMAEQLTALGAPEDTREIDAKIADHRKAMDEYQRAVEVHGDRKRRWREQDAFYTAWQEALKKHADLDGRIKALMALPSELFARADLPIKGMFIEGDEIMLPDENGELQPAASFGEAKVLDMYIALAMALAPLPVLLVDGLERCGPKRSKEIYDRLREKGFQLLGTRVTSGEFHVVHVDDTVPPAAAPVAAPEEQPLLDIPD